MQKIILKKDILKGDYQKPLKKLTFFSFWTQSHLMNKVIKNKRGQKVVTSRFSGYETRSQKFLYYVFSDQVWWCNMKRFFSYSKNYTCKPIHDIINYSTFICPFASGKWRNEQEKLRKIWISRERENLFRWNKKHFSQFLKGYDLVKK